MNKKLNYKNQMFWAVLTVLLKFKSLWEAIPLMATLVKELSDNLEEIKKTAKLAGVSLTGVTENKNATLKSLNNLVYVNASVLSTFSKRTGNFIMHSEVDFPESHLDNLKQTEALELAEKILKMLKDNLEALGEYGITSADVEALQLIIDQFAEALPLTKASIAERKAANEKLDKLITASDEFLKSQLDKMLVSFRHQSPDFYTAYINSRDVTIYGVRHVKDKTPVEKSDKIG